MITVQSGMARPATTVAAKQLHLRERGLRTNELAQRLYYRAFTRAVPHPPCHQRTTPFARRLAVGSHKKGN